MTTRLKITQFITELYNSMDTTGLIIVVCLLGLMIVLGRYWFRNV